MATFIKGRGEARLLRDGSVTTDKYGLATASAEWWAFQERGLRKVTMIGASHPTFSSLHCERITVLAKDGGYSLIAFYAGIEGTPEPVDELDTCSIEAPIDTHPNFADFAGTPAAPLNGAVFIPVGEAGTMVFDRFGPDAPAEFRGVTSYLIPTAISRRTSITTSVPSAANVGTIEAPPETFGLSAQWLKTGVAAEKRGNVYTVREEWKASGPGGWSATIYAP